MAIIKLIKTVDCPTFTKIIFDTNNNELHYRLNESEDIIPEEGQEYKVLVINKSKSHKRIIISVFDNKKLVYQKSLVIAKTWNGYDPLDGIDENQEEPFKSVCNENKRIFEIKDIEYSHLDISKHAIKLVG